MTSLSETLEPLFGPDAPTYYTDSSPVADYLRGQDLPVASISVLPDVAPGDVPAAVVIPTSAKDLPPEGALDHALDRTRVLVLPILAFCGCDRAALYYLERLTMCDVVSTCATNRRWMNMLETVDREIGLIGPTSTATIELGHDISIMSPKLEPSLDTGEWASASQYLELGIVPGRPSDDDAPFDLRGKLVADGIVVAHHRQLKAQAQPLALAAWDYLRNLRLNGRFPLTLHVEGAHIKSIRTSDDGEVLHDLVEFVDPHLGSFVVEFGLASDTQTVPANWSINSQMNEGIGGLHVAIGSGLRGAHIDFVCSDVVVDVC